MARDLKLEVVLQALDRASKPFKTIGKSSVGLANDLRNTRTELKGLQAQQKDVSSFRALRTASDKTGSALQENRDKIRQLSRELGAAEQPSKALTRSFRDAVRQGQALKTKHAEQQRELQGLRGKLNAAGVSTRNLGQHERELRQSVNRANQSLSQQESRLRRLTAQQQRLASAKQGFQRTQGLAGSMAAQGAGGLAAGSGILYSGARMLAPGLDFDASMSKVQALTRLDKNSPQLKALRDQARELGSSTQFTAGEAANAQGFLGMAGFKPEAIKDAMPGMLDLAKAGDSDLAETADIASNILTGFNLQAKETGRLGDVLVGTFTRSNTNLQMLGDTMKYVAPVASSVGQDIETVAAMAGKLGDAGIQGSMGGTALRAIMSRLSAPPKMAAAALDQLGISAKDAQGNLRDMPTVLQEIYDKTKNMGDADRAGLLKGIAGEEAVSGLQVLVKQAGTGELQKFIGTLRQTRGEAHQTAKVMGDNLKGDITALGSAWDDLGIQIQEQQDGPFRDLAQTVTRIVGGVKSWVAENPKLAGEIIKTATGIGVLMAGMGGLTLAMASLLGPFAVVRYGLMLFGIRSAGLLSPLLTLGRTALPLVAKGIMLIGRAMLLNPIGLAITAIAGGAYLIYRNWDTVGPYFKGLWAEIKQGFSGGLGDMATTILNFSPQGLFYRAFAGVMNYFGAELPAKFSDFGAMLIDGLVSGFTGALGKLKTAITGAGDSTIGWFKDKLGIHSPSRVFAELGGYTMAGLSQGIERNQSGPLASITSLGKQLAQAGALTLGIGAGSAVALDSRAPLAAGNSKPAINIAGDTIQITITAGADAASIEQLLNKLLNERERNKAARVRSALFDTE
ncbi:phage tail tape measure protein [Pseudomonas marincola]|uniref:phage tail tape measure protein n=1 Tax=Pseudomonas marincola TaxID=437900 RepID=UPI0008F041ED|nr:phage tail tape measure protein [Pseudomonas marincola]SFT49242.1 phage tail tape measure protein, TP901 family, core region [Pseudomonas marincola]